MLKNQYKLENKNIIKDEFIEEIEKIESLFFLDSNYNKKDLIELIESNNHYFYLLVFEKKIIAYCIYSLSIDEIEIYKIFVDEYYRKNGLAKNIINEIIEKNKPKNIFVDLNEKNKIAKLFYEKLNFKIIRVRNNYYKDGSNSLTLKKII